MFLSREGVNNPVDGFRRAGRMQGTKHQMAGLSCRQCHGNGFIIAHLTEQDNIGVFAQRAFQRRGKTHRVAPDFALRDDGINLRMNEFHRVLNGNNML